MVSLRDKLDRLGAGVARGRPATPVPPRTSAADGSASPESSPAAPAERPAEVVQGTATRVPTLAELRARLATLVAPAAANAEPARAPAQVITERELGFEPVAREPAGCWVRRQTFEPAHRIGDIGLGTLLGADRHLLALLSLTPSIDSCDPRRALYLDTETTGLGGVGTVAFLLGLCWYEAAEARFVLEQWLLTELGAEAALLDAVRERLDAAELVVTYNGKSFDLPLLRTRMVMQRLAPLRELPHVDLLHLVRRVHRRRRWRKSLPTVEASVLGFARGPDVAGEEVAQRYHHYLRSRDLEGVVPIILHNAHDVLSLVALVGLYGEPLERLPADDLAELARTLHRAGDAARARDVVHHAVARGGGPEALRVRAELAKARGDRGQALADFEQLATEIDDPRVRLELAKLYEHHVRSPLLALEVVAGGTGEAPEAEALRRARLERKSRRGVPS